MLLRVCRNLLDSIGGGASLLKYALTNIGDTNYQIVRRFRKVVPSLPIHLSNATIYLWSPKFLSYREYRNHPDLLIHRSFYHTSALLWCVSSSNIRLFLIAAKATTNRLGDFP